MPTNPLKTIKESIENLRENIWTFDKNENDIINVDFDEAERENAINTSSVCLELICKGWFLPPNTYMTAAHLW